MDAVTDRVIVECKHPLTISVTLNATCCQMGKLPIVKTSFHAKITSKGNRADSKQNGKQLNSTHISICRGKVEDHLVTVFVSQVMANHLTILMQENWQLHPTLIGKVFGVAAGRLKQYSALGFGGSLICSQTMWSPEVQLSIRGRRYTII